jgi:hypothetical protein
VSNRFAEAIVIVERELGFPIYEDYPLLKFFIQLECLAKFKKEELAQSKKSLKQKGAMRK